MGDRALIVVKDGNEYAPCAVYLHWGGNNAPKLIGEAIEYMKGREGDPEYATARLVGIAHERTKPHNTSLGVLPAPEIADIENGFTEYSHGDAGVAVWDCGTNEVIWFAGYHAKK